ncbi:MAG: putative zinc-binding metallopeptidase, partial [Proteobacteria bacterium]|nr:putative zinc-binding metallopeptidase [Pseudomonadota bacterium]
MKIFECQACRNTLHFDNTTCLACGSRVGFEPTTFDMLALRDDGGKLVGTTRTGEARVPCKNWDAGVCNWLVPVEAAGGLCPACRHNRTIPDLAVPGNAERWAKLEAAKHHLFYSLRRFGLPVDRHGATTEPLIFDFLADVTEPDGTVKTVLTGHADGVITLNIAEADDAEREKRRVAMGEPYRTALGHFRHEIGHYYWDLLVKNSDQLQGFRNVFGDESADYGTELAAYHKNGPKP